MELLEILSVLLTSAIKFLPAPFLAVNVYGFKFGQAVLMTTAGGVLGILFFFFASGELMERARVRRMRRMAEGKEPRKRFFTRRNKLMVRIKQGSGIVGLAIITPAIISIPIGCVLAAKYFRKEAFTLPALLLSLFLWSLLLSGIASLFGSPFHHHN